MKVLSTILFFLLGFNSIAQEFNTGEIDPGQIVICRSMIDVANEKLKSEPENEKLYQQRAMAFFVLKEYNNAINDFSKLIEMKTEKKSEYYFYRGLSKLMSQTEYQTSACDDIKNAKLEGFKKDDWKKINEMCGLQKKTFAQPLTGVIAGVSVVERYEVQFAKP